MQIHKLEMEILMLKTSSVKAQNEKAWARTVAVKKPRQSNQVSTPNDYSIEQSDTKKRRTLKDQVSSLTQPSPNSVFFAHGIGEKQEMSEEAKDTHFQPASGVIHSRRNAVNTNHQHHNRALDDNLNTVTKTVTDDKVRHMRDDLTTKYEDDIGQTGVTDLSTNQNGTIESAKSTQPGEGGGWTRPGRTLLTPDNSGTSPSIVAHGPSMEGGKDEESGVREKQSVPQKTRDATYQGLSATERKKDVDEEPVSISTARSLHRNDDSDSNSRRMLSENYDIKGPNNHQSKPLTTNESLTPSRIANIKVFNRAIGSTALLSPANDRRYPDGDFEETNLNSSNKDSKVPQVIKSSKAETFASHALRHLLHGLKSRSDANHVSDENGSNTRGIRASLSLSEEPDMQRIQSLAPLRPPREPEDGERSSSDSSASIHSPRRLPDHNALKSPGREKEEMNSRFAEAEMFDPPAPEILRHVQARLELWQIAITPWYGVTRVLLPLSESSIHMILKDFRGEKVSVWLVFSRLAALQQSCVTDLVSYLDSVWQAEGLQWTVLAIIPASASTEPVDWKSFQMVLEGQPDFISYNSKVTTVDGEEPDARHRRGSAALETEVEAQHGSAVRDKRQTGPISAGHRRESRAARSTPLSVEKEDDQSPRAQAKRVKRPLLLQTPEGGKDEGMIPIRSSSTLRRVNNSNDGGRYENVERLRQRESQSKGTKYKRASPQENLAERTSDAPNPGNLASSLPKAAKSELSEVGSSSTRRRRWPKLKEFVRHRVFKSKGRRNIYLSTSNPSIIRDNYIESRSPRLALIQPERNRANIHRAHTRAYDSTRNRSMSPHQKSKMMKRFMKPKLREYDEKENLEVEMQYGLEEEAPLDEAPEEERQTKRKPPKLHAIGKKEDTTRKAKVQVRRVPENQSFRAPMKETVKKGGGFLLQGSSGSSDTSDQKSTEGMEAENTMGLSRPTYIKIHKKYLCRETIDEYDLPWTTDKVSHSSDIDPLSHSFLMVTIAI